MDSLSSKFVIVLGVLFAISVVVAGYYKFKHDDLQIKYVQLQEQFKVATDANTQLKDKIVEQNESIQNLAKAKTELESNLRKANEEISSSQVKLKQLVSQARVSIVPKDCDGSIAWLNQSFNNASGVWNEKVIIHNSD